MKILYLLSLTAAVHAFAPNVQTSFRTTIVLDANHKKQFQTGFFDGLFRPIHGHGSGESKLGELYKAEQELLKERKEKYRKDQLKEKYGKTKATSWIDNILSHPFHTHGSGEKDYDAMYAAQQQVLYERREYYGNKDMLRKKYHASKDHLKDIPVHQFDPAALNKKEDDAMYVEEKGNGGFAFFKNFNPKLKP